MKIPVDLSAASCSWKSYLITALCSEESNLAAGNQTFGDPPKALKGQSCKKSYIGELHYLIPMGIIY
jgi:hypothetical protein